MSNIVKRTFVGAALLTLVAGWMSLVVKGEEKQKAKVSETHKPSIQAPENRKGPANVTRNGEVQQIFYPALTKRELKIQEALNAETECDFPDVPLSEVMDELADRHGITILILRNDLEEEGISVDESIDTRLQGIPLKYALGLILEPMALTYVVDRDVVQITTQIKAEEMLKTRVYPVGDFCNAPDDYLSLDAAIKNASLGEWRIRIPAPKQSKPVNGHLGGGLGGGLGGAGGAGGGFFQVANKKGLTGTSRTQVYMDGPGGTITFVPQSQSLVITQTYHAHNAIVDLLTQLRQAQAAQ